jgi:hypothetical protein
VQPAIWPAADVVFDTPEAAAADFVSTVLRVPPTLGEFQQGDPDSGEIGVRDRRAVVVPDGEAPSAFPTRARRQPDVVANRQCGDQRRLAMQTSTRPLDLFPRRHHQLRQGRSPDGGHRFHSCPSKPLAAARDRSRMANVDHP